MPSQLIHQPVHILIVSHDVVKQNMAGPGIRYWELANVLTHHMKVTLAVPGDTDLGSDTVRLRTYEPHEETSFLELAETSDIIFGTQDLLHRFPRLSDLDKPLIVDLYTPALLENLELHRHLSMREREFRHQNELTIMLDLVRRGDFFVCATERQLDFWSGVLLTAHRVSPLTYGRDESLRQLIDIVPFGIPSEPPRATRPVVKGVIPGIGKGDKLIYWGGGIWNWLDPLTPIRAMREVVASEPSARLLFLAGRHPNPGVPAMEMAVRAEHLAEELGLRDRHVFFLHEWVPYEDRANYLLEADVAVSAHSDHIETRFSFRTRLLDCIWAGLPMVVSDGDAVADWVKNHNLGAVVNPGDAEGMARSLIDMLNLPDDGIGLSSNFDELRPRLTWENVAQPLVRFCLQPRKTSDHATTATGTVPDSPSTPTNSLRRIPS